MDTIFAKIIDRKIPAHIVYEDDVIIAFLDINPINKGHTLIVPKKHFVNIFDGDSQILAQMMEVGQKLAQALKTAGLADGINIIMNNGEEAGQEIPHAHLHVVPRLKNDNSLAKPKHVECNSEEFLVIEERLKVLLG